MTRKRATVIEKKRRRAYVLRMIGEGWGLSELTTHVQDLWGLSRAQARRYVKDAHAEMEDFGNQRFAGGQADIARHLVVSG